MILGVLGIGQVAAAPDKVASEQLSPSARVQAETHKSVFSPPETLSIHGVRLGMSRDQVHSLNLTKWQWPSSLQFNRDGQVSFVAGGELSQASKSLGYSEDPVRALHTWGQPRVQFQEGSTIVCGYRTSAGLVLVRYNPTTLDRRSGALGDIALARNLASIPWDWNPVRLQNAGL
jgi:hypothetical protein